VGTSTSEYHAQYARYIALKRQLDADTAGASRSAGVTSSSTMSTLLLHSTAAAAAAVTTAATAAAAAAPALPPSASLANAAAARPRAEVSPSPPEELLCPIVMELMVDPVSTADGQCYERAAIERWLRTQTTSPLTGLVLPSRNLLPNIPLRKMCADWRQRLELGGRA